MAVVALVRVEAPHFVAGLVIEHGVCVRAAPILRWCERKSLHEVQKYFRTKGWRYTVLVDRLRGEAPTRKP